MRSNSQPEGPPHRGPSCPTLEELGQYAARLRSGESVERSAEILDHITDCAACAARIADMRDGEDEAGVVLRIRTKAWQEKMLTRISRELGGEREPIREKKRLWRAAWNWTGWAVAAVTVVASAAWWSAARNSPERAFRLLAQAYTAQRPFEWRIAGAEYAQTERGALDSLNLSLLDAQRLIAEEVQKKSDVADWLRAKARAELLESHYTSAIESLRRAEETEPNNPAILGDLGIAYLQRAEKESRPQDVAQAIEYLFKAVAALSSEPSCRFNLALAYEGQMAWRQALEQWNGLLKLEKSGGWAGEARQHAERIQKMLKDQAGRQSAPRASEDAIPALAASGFRSTPSIDADAVADDLASKHGDPWMRNFLKTRGTRQGVFNQNQAAISALAQAAKGYSLDQASAGVEHARSAAQLFRQAQNTPGAVFAAFQQAYGLQRLSQSEPCIDTASAALPAAHSHGYLWLEAQLNLTLSGCLINLHRFDRAHEAILSAQAVAEKAGYDSLMLRSLIARAETLRILGSYREALATDTDGLRRYWSGVGNLTHGYQLYYDAGMTAAGLHDLHAASSLLNEAVELTTLLPYRMVEAMARSRFAAVLMEDGQTHEAGEQFEVSEKIFRAMPQSADALFYGSYAGLSRARLDGRENQASKGLARINILEPRLAAIGNPNVEALLWGVKSELLIRAGRPAESEEPLRRILALGTSERNRSSGIGDSSELAREVSQAVDTLTDQDFQRGDAAQAWQLWTQYNPCFRTVPAGARGAARLIFTELPSGPVAWISDGNGIAAKRLRISNQELERIASNFRRVVANRDEPLSRIRSMGREIYGQIFAPLESRLQPAQQLYIAAGGAFASVPFAALVSGDGQWLGDRYRIMYSPPLAGASDPVAATPAKDPNMVAASYGQASEILQTAFPPLPDVEADMDAIAEAIPHPTMLRKASVASVLDALPHAGILHFSGHSFVTAGDAALVLAPGGGADSDRLLWVSKIPAQSLRRCRLVMLAACSTGRAAGEDNDPSSVMARTFLLKGVPEVIASRWDVDSSAASFLVARFYQMLAKGASAEEALYSSVVQLRNQPAFGHPYFWAAFDLFRS